MLYGTPQNKGRDKITRRVKILKLWSEDAADEMLLTAIEEAMQSEGVRIEVHLPTDRTFIWYTEKS